MKKVFLGTSSLALGAALFVTGNFCGRNAAPRPAAEMDRKVLYYVDPMNPAHTSDRPGVAPCGMKMEPVFANDEPGLKTTPAPSQPGSGSVRVSTRQQQLIGLRVAFAEQVPVTNHIRLFARVVPDDRRVYRINAGVEGIIREVSGVTIGSLVKKDQWLATFSAPDTRSSIAGFLTAVDVLERQEKTGQGTTAQLNILQDNIRQAADRLQNLGLAPIQIDEIRHSRVVPAALRVHAPIEGYLLAHNVTPGFKFEKGTEWYRIADLGHVWVLADVQGSEAEFFLPGTLAHVSVPGVHKLLPARVSEALPQFDAASRTLKVRFEADNPDVLLRPDMFVDVMLSVPLPPALMVSSDAVLETGLKTTVFVDCGNGFFEPRSVETGRRLGDLVEILKGLNPGEQIVTAANFLVDSESRMKLAAAGSQSASAKDPVCGMRVDEQKARVARRFSEYHGTTYYFCNEDCKQSFDEAPARFTQNNAVVQVGPAPSL